ncbi:DUF2938 domain-containing protein [Enterovibrio coralii]|uniref:Uncharacterized protein n=1 Tax=Enterovibrio coralii TaxID=294935 RepID=A0A135I5P7_9GAMM|nr:DUF2938 domain-containing protein [Enterovibrio coralii]KXF80761.1 hypothetical protein ATN88_15875 [Enterovibrio coralii]
MNTILFTILIGAGATATMDLWGIVRAKLFGIPALNFALVGRWLGHMLEGKFRHDSIAAAKRVRGESLIGWSAHYLIGIGFAAILIGLFGEGWIQNPTLLPALFVGVATVVAPFFIMQPGMGAGIAASRTPNPNGAKVQSLVNHSVFGLGLYVSGIVAAAILRY